MKGSVIRVATGVAVLAVLMSVVAMPASAAVTPPAAPKVDIAHPASGDHLRRGTIWVTGVACDPNAALTDTSAGISRIQVFTGDRDLASGTAFYRPGGFFGSATATGLLPDFSSNFTQSSRLGLANPDVSVGCRHSFAGFRILTAAFRRGTYNLNIYVLTKAGNEIKIPIDGIVVDQG
jgi:hypothetical protein